LTHTDIDRL